MWQSLPTAVGPLQLLIAHELDGAVGHSKKTWCKSLVQTSHTLVPSKLPQTICEEERHQTGPPQTDIKYVHYAKVYNNLDVLYLLTYQTPLCTVAKQALLQLCSDTDES